jgi:biofilm PGA synthesis N-glycosyltransferase PgaC
MMFAFFRPMITGRTPSLLPTYINYVLSLLWSYTMLLSFCVGLLWLVGLAPPSVLPGYKMIPEWWGLTLAVTYIAQALVSHLLERRYDRHMLRSLFWMIWYPMAFWLIGTATTVAAFPRVLLQPRQERTTWVSPDRGLR